VAVAVNADLLISGNRHLLALGTHLGIRIITAAEVARRIAGP
jgi:hypothetical protein